MNWETSEAYVLAGLGAVQGFVRYGSPAARAWAVIGLGVLSYEVMCPVGETLSEGCDRALEQHKLLTIGAIAVTAAHLANVIPPKYDPYHRLTLLKP